MKKMHTRLFALSLLAVLLCGIGTAFYMILFVLRDDTTPPVITMDSDRLSVSVSAAEEELLRGVTALDKRDGDVTAKLLIENIGNITAEHTALVTYAAFDVSGNVSKASRTLEFTDYKSPTFGLSRALVFPSGVVPDVLSHVTAADVIDGDLSSQVKGTLISDTTSLAQAGIHEVEFRVTNSMGDTSHITIPVDIYNASDYNASVSLTDYLVYIPRGSAFQPESYLASMSAGSTEYPLVSQTIDLPGLGRTSLRVYINNHKEYDPSEDTGILVNVTTDGRVDTNVPGVYSVSYTVALHRNTASYLGFTRLVVVVEE